MKLSQLLQNITIVKTTGSLDIEITGLASDSRSVRPGYVFIAAKGQKADGYQFIEEAIWRGAVAVVADRDYINNRGITLIIVDSPHNTLSQLAAGFYGDPGSRLRIIGVTGTNGKTTTAYLIQSIFEKAGTKTGLLGTIDYVLGERRIPSVLTTPDVLTLNQFLAQMRDAGCRVCVMEVSSHALHQGRTDGISYQSAVFTNLGRDHLDYHNTAEEYLDVKARLFKGLSSKSWAVVNMDDPCHNTILQNTLAKVAGYGIKRVSSSNIRARGISLSGDGARFSVYAPEFGAGFTLETHLAGIHNVYNILAAVSVGLCQGVPVDAIREGVLSVKNVPGRLQKIDFGQPFKVIVDYAHTPDALESILNAIRDMAAGRLILVFGCGGSRDKQKRPIMGRIASRKADYSLITTDNPRDEEPVEIIKDIERGFVGRNYRIIVDRKEAIIEGLRMAKPGDCVIIAGKGHENYQILRHTIVPFSDKGIVEEFLANYATYIS